MRRYPVALMLLILLFTATAMAASDDRHRPFVLAQTTDGSLDDARASVTSALQGAGFQIAGEYAPYAGSHVLVITDDALRQHAAQSDFGGYGAALRVGLAAVDGKVQVSYTNPSWMVNIYRMSGDLAEVTERMKSALGWQKDYGSSGGRTEKNLREYHYMMFMPYFDDHVKLASFGSHGEAVDAVEAGLAGGSAGVGKISRVDVPGKEEVLFNVSIKEGKGADEPVMAIIDQSDPRHPAHLPYDILVSGSSVYALHGKFRIAQSFPDLTMTTFMKISDAPDAIAASLKAAVGGK
jgi:hypothetical protein